MTKLDFISKDMLKDSPELLADIQREARAILSLCTYTKQCAQLHKVQQWANFDWRVIYEMANAVDEPFVKLMLSLDRHKYKYNAISMHAWWRRLKAVNQQHLITFFSYVNFVKPQVISWEIVYSQCCKTKETLELMSEQFADDRAVEMNCRALMGCSQSTGLKIAWATWAKQNHPDKGGDPNNFVLVKAAYEEYLKCKTQ